MASLLPIGLFILYSGLFAWHLVKGRNFDPLGLAKTDWVGIFSLKIVAACFYGWWYAKLPGDQADTWWFYREALTYTSMLTEDPLRMLTTLFESDPNQPTGLFHHQGYWNDLRANVFVRLLSVVLLVSAGNYYVACVCFAILGFWSGYFFCKTLAQLTHRPVSRIEALFLTCLPSVLFWTGGIHRDAILLLCLSGIIWQMVRQMQAPHGKNAFYSVLLLLPILVLRSYWAMILIPTLLAWFATMPRRAPWTIAALAGAQVLAWMLFLHNPSMLEQLIQNRQAFLDLKGRSLLLGLSLHADPLSFLSQIPTAVTNFCWIPTQSGEAGPLYLLSQLEMGLLTGLLVYTFFQYRHVRVSVPMQAFLIALFCMVCLACMLIGWTIPYAGAMVRYRAPFLELIALGIWLSRRHI